MLAIIFFVLAVISAALYTKFQSVFLVCFAAVFCVTAVVFLMRCSKARRAAEDARLRRRRILDKYNVRSASDIRAALDEQGALCEAVAEAVEAERRTREAYDSARERQEQLEASALGELDFSGGSSPAAQLSRQLAAERQSAEQISSQIAALNGKLAATGDPLVLSSELSSMQDEYDELLGEYDAITLAVDTLRAADAELQSRFRRSLASLRRSTCRL